jgi:S1-C subfamily serine protease
MYSYRWFAVLVLGFVVVSDGHAFGPGGCIITDWRLPNVVTPRGVSILEVGPASPAKQIGLEVGDMIVAIDGIPIQTAESFRILTARGPSVILTVRDVRTGRYVEQTIKPTKGLIGIRFAITAIPQR